MKVRFSSINKTLLMLFLFVAVNDLVLVPFGILWIKNMLVFLLFFCLHIKLKLRFTEYFTYLFVVASLFVISFSVAASYSNNLNYAASENFALLITFIVPIIVLNWINVDPNKIVGVLNVFLWAILFATLYKILFVIYMQGYLSFGLFDFIYKDVLGRGVVGEIYRLNTGNQLLVSFALFMAYRFFAIGYKKLFMSIVMAFCVINMYFAASRFFSVATFALLGIFILFGGKSIKSNWVQKFFFTALVAIIAFFQIDDLLSGREALNTTDADSIYRIYQAKFLFESFFVAPFFGNGPGFAIHDADYDLPWAFENQTLVVFAKYGLIGFFLIVSIIALQFKIFKFPLSLFHYLMFILFIVIASIFNPYLFGTYAACAFSIALILAYLFKESNRELILLSTFGRQYK
jgi:hypothetical protein